MKLQRMLLGNKIESIQSLRLRFRNGRNIATTRKTPVSRKGTTSILNEDSFRCFVASRLVIQQGTRSVSRRASFSKSTDISHVIVKNLADFDTLIYIPWLD